MIERIGKDIIVNGDVRPGADYYDRIDDEVALNDDARDLKDALENQADGSVSPEVLEAAHEAAIAEKRVRGFGASQERIASIVGKRYEIKLVRLALEGIDISNAHPPEESVIIGVPAQKSSISAEMSSDEDEEEEKPRDPDWRERQFKDW